MLYCAGAVAKGVLFCVLFQYSSHERDTHSCLPLDVFKYMILFEINIVVSTLARAPNVAYKTA